MRVMARSSISASRSSISLSIFTICVLEAVFWSHPLSTSETHADLRPSQTYMRVQVRLFERANVAESSSTNIEVFDSGDFFDPVGSDLPHPRLSKEPHTPGQHLVLEGEKGDRKEIGGDGSMRRSFSGSFYFFCPPSGSDADSSSSDVTRSFLASLLQSALALCAFALVRQEASKLMFLAFVAFNLLTLPVVKGDPLEDWVASLVVHIPDQAAEKAGLRLHMNNLTCDGMALAGLGSSVDLATPALAVEVTGLTLSCTGLWSYEQVLLPKLVNGHGTVSFGLLPSSAQLSVGFGSTRGLPSSLTLLHCTPAAKLSKLSFSGGITGDVLELFSTPLRLAITSAINDLSCSALKKAFASTVNPALTNLTTLLAPFLARPTPRPPPVLPADSVPMLGNGFVGVVDYLTDAVVGSNGVLNLNFLASRFTHGTGVAAVAPPDGVAVNLTTPFGTLAIRLDEVSVGGLTSFRNVSLFVPVSKYVVDSSLSLDSLDVNLTMAVGVNLDGPQAHGALLWEPFTLRLALSNTEIGGRAVVGAPPDVLSKLSPQEFLEPGCLAHAVDTFNLTLLTLDTTILHLALDTPLKGLEAQVDQLVDDALALVLHAYGPSLTALIDGAVDGPLRVFLNEAIANTSANAVCAPGPAQAEELNEAALVTSFSAALVLSLCVAAYIAAASSRARAGKKQARGSTQKSLLDEDFAAPVASGARSSVVSFVDEDEEMGALATSQRLPAWLRMCVPALLFVNIAMFITANLSLGAGVFVNFVVDGVPYAIPPVFEFTLANSVEDMWNAGVYPLSIIIAVFSGGWPYLKLLAMLACWLLPARVFSAGRRETCLRVLDALGKYSLVDNYMLIMMMVAFFVHIEIPQVAGDDTQPDYAAVIVQVLPYIGFFLFIGGAMLSLAMTHVILAGLRRVEESKSAEVIAFVEEGSPAEALATIPFLMGGRSVRCTRSGRVAVAGVLALAIALVIAGSIIDSMRFEYQGMARLALGFVGFPTDQQYSILSLADALPRSTFPEHQPMMYVVQAVFIILTFVIPLLHLIALFILWVVPMVPKRHRLLFVTTEVLNAWSALEVFGLAVVASLLQLEQFAAFIIGDKCDLVNNILTNYFATALPPGDTICARIVAKLAPGCYMLILACFMYIIVGYSLMSLCHKVLHQNGAKFGRKSQMTSDLDEEEETPAKPKRHHALLFKLGLVETTTHGLLNAL